MIPLTPFILASSLLGLGVSVVALPQDNSVVTPGVTSTGALPSSTASVSAESATPIPASVLNSLPIIPVEGDDSSAIIQATNSSLLETHPEINVEPAIELPAVPSNLTRRDQCVGGPFASPVTPWTNVKLLADRVCDFWFPNNQVFYVSAPLPAPGFIRVQIPLGPSLPTLNFKYETRNPTPVNDLFTPLTSTICKKRFDSILAFATNSGNFQCPSPPFVSAANDCDISSRAACFSFYLN